MLAQILLLIACCVVAVALARRVGLPPILGYLFVGVLVGPNAAGWFNDNHALHLAGEIGIAFLLFVIGLEFSLPQFLKMRHVLLGLGGAQMLIGTASGGLIAWWLGISPGAAVVVGGALAMSSTAIVVKQLTEQLELQTRHGNLALGILLFQDLAAVPLLVVIPVLVDDSGNSMLGALSLALAKGVLVVGAMLALGRYVLRPIFHEAAAARSAELFTLTALMVSLFAAWATARMGLSLALGAFVAGMMLSETEYRHQLEVELRPFKDLLLGLFFITVGMRLDLFALPGIGPATLLLAAGLVLGKGGVIALLTWLWGRDRGVAVRTGAILGHGGEFGFALLALSLGTGLLGEQETQPILAGIIVSMLLAPLLVRHNVAFAERLLPTQTNIPAAADAAEISSAVHGIAGHVVIGGYGRVGRQVASVLRAEGVDFVAADLHPASIREAWEAGDKVFYGDITHAEILRALGVERARALVLCFDDESAALRMLHHCAHNVGDIPVLVRARDARNLERLIAAGAHTVIPETLETSLMLGTQVLSVIGIDEARIDACIRELRAAHYTPLRNS